MQLDIRSHQLYIVSVGDSVEVWFSGDVRDKIYFNRTNILHKLTVKCSITMFTAINCEKDFPIA